MILADVAFCLWLPAAKADKIHRMKKRHRLYGWYRELVNDALNDLEDAGRVARQILTDQNQPKEAARLHREYAALRRQLQELVGSDAPSREPTH